MADAPIIVPIALGIVQGVTEFLPISSSAHLRVVPVLMHWEDPGVAYDAVIQLGSSLAVITYFAKDLSNICAGTIKAIQKKDFAGNEVRLAGAIIFGTIPVCVLGLLLHKVIEQPGSPIRSLVVIALSSICMGLFLLAAEKIGTHRRGIDSIGGKDGLLVGLGQAMALIPGCSRSGSTLTVAMLLNLKRADAARFSFLLSIPANVISGLYEGHKMLSEGMSGSAVSELVIGFVVSTLVSYAAIAWLLRYLQNHSTYIFVAYRLLFGIVLLALTTGSMIHDQPDKHSALVDHSMQTMQHAPDVQARQQAITDPKSNN